MKLSSKYIGIFLVFLWVFITIQRIIFHQPWYDEAHAYMMAQHMSVLDLIATMKNEGHLIIWYLLIMPFAKLKLWYPYPMQIINWLFAFGAILVMWKKAPFHPITKAVITFSCPFLLVLPVIARCYAIGVFLIFLLAVLYKNSLKHPIWYSILLILAANTSLMVLFGATAFGLVFSYNMIKGALKDEVTKKDFRIVFSILALGGVLVLWQIGGAVQNDMSIYSEQFINHFVASLIGAYPFLSERYVYISGFVCAAALIVLSVSFAFIVFSNRRVFFIMSFMFGSLLYCFLFKFRGDFHNWMFFWIYATVILWIFFEEGFVKTKIKITAEIILILLYSLVLSSNVIGKWELVSKTKTMYNIISAKIEPDSRIILTDYLIYAIVPYFVDKNSPCEFYSYHTNNNAYDEPWDSLYYSRDIPLLLDKDNHLPNPILLYRVLAKDKNNYIICENVKSDIVLNYFDKKIYLKHVENLFGYRALYRITVY